MNKKQVADRLAAEFEEFMRRAWPDCPRGGTQWREQWKAFLGGVMASTTIVYHSPESILLIGGVTAELAMECVQPGRRN